MFWKRLCKYLFVRRRRHLTIQDFYAMDTDVGLAMWMIRHGLYIENGEIVEGTAIITADRDVQPTHGPLPTGYPFRSLA